jgi:hypothetical protein
MYQSRLFAFPQMSDAEQLRLTVRYGVLLDEARAALSGITVRYEDLTDSPADTVRGICDYLGVAWEPAMLDYAVPRILRLGDWGDRIASGVIQKAGPAPEYTPPELEDLAVRWGYT